ncbi:MAG: hypothetical protein IJI87_10225 [Mogibacterium sp.]|nr:hypothetical protein [Mogibacterium sp.]
MQTINLNLVPGKVKPVVHSSQYDKGRTFRCYLFDGSTNYTLDGTETITIEGQKSDSHIFLYSVTNTESNYVDVATTEQMTAVSGLVDCELRIKKGDTDIGTANFWLEVEKASTENGTLSESDISLLREVEDATESAATSASDSAEAAAASAEQAAAWAASTAKKLILWRDPTDNGLNWTYDPDLPD